MKHSIYLLLMISGFVLVQSCYYDNPPELIPFDCADVSYSTHIQPIWDGSCATSGCHDGSREPNLTAEVGWTELQAGGFVNLNLPEESSLYKSVTFEESAMPPGGPKLSQQNIELILCWIQEGALNN